LQLLLCKLTKTLSRLVIIKLFVDILCIIQCASATTYYIAQNCDHGRQADATNVNEVCKHRH